MTVNLSEITLSEHLLCTTEERERNNNNNNTNSDEEEEQKKNNFESKKAHTHHITAIATKHFILKHYQWV